MVESNLPITIQARGYSEFGLRRIDTVDFNSAIDEIIIINPNLIDVQI